MAKAFTEWKVLPHGPIEKLSENLWWVQGSLPGMSLKRVMTIVRRSDAGLVVHNGIALGAAAMRQIEDWGQPSQLIVPNGYHRLDAPAYKQRYPELRVYAPRGSRERVAQVVTVDGSYQDFPADENVWFEVLDGVGEAEAAMMVRSEDGLTAVFSDLVFNMDRKRDPMGFLITTLAGSAPGPRISRLTKLAMIKDRKALRASLEKIASLPNLTRLIVAHEKIASGHEAPAALRQAATFL